MWLDHLPASVAHDRLAASFLRTAGEQFKRSAAVELGTARRTGRRHGRGQHTPPRPFVHRLKKSPAEAGP